MSDMAIMDPSLLMANGLRGPSGPSVLGPAEGESPIKRDTAITQSKTLLWKGIIFIIIISDITKKGKE